MIELAVIPTRAIGRLEPEERDPWASANRLTSRRKRLPMPPSTAIEAIGLPKCPVMNRTTCPATCRFGTYALSNMRSTHSRSNATCPSSTSLMFVTLALPAIAPASPTRGGSAAPTPVPPPGEAGRGLAPSR